MIPKQLLDPAQLKKESEKKKNEVTDPTNDRNEKKKEGSIKVPLPTKNENESE